MPGSNTSTFGPRSGGRAASGCADAGAKIDNVVNRIAESDSEIGTGRNMAMLLCARSALCPSRHALPPAMWSRDFCCVQPYGLEVARDAPDRRASRCAPAQDVSNRADFVGLSPRL